MPAYTTIAFHFPRNSCAGLVRKVYAAFTSSGLPFSHVLAWGCSPNLTLEEITQWNQDRLDANFELGYSDGISNDYRQVLLSGHPFSECRVFILKKSDSVAFHCIVPESEITDLNCEGIRLVAERIWETLPAGAIDSYGEWADDDITPPVARLFAYVNSATDEMLPARFKIQPLLRGYRLTRKDIEQGNESHESEPKSAF